MLSVFTMVTPALDATLPVGRFGGLIWLIAVSVLLPVTRQRANTVPAAPAPIRTAGRQGQRSDPATSTEPSPRPAL
jgi:hypothetical protein